MATDCRLWPPPRRGVSLALAFPASILAVEDTLLLKTLKAGLVGRVLSIFRVSEAALFKDPDTSKSDFKLLKLLLEYQVTPPHLKKKVFPLRRELRYASLIPPLKIPSHLVPEEPLEGAVLDGLIEECVEGYCRVFLGRAGYGVLHVDSRRDGLRRGSIVTVKIHRVVGGRVMLKPASWGPVYTGFKVRVFNNIESLVGFYRSRGYYIVATDRRGACPPESWELLKNVPARNSAIVFGGPYRGILEYSEPEIYNAIINTVPLQGSETVRTEEAMVATLSALSVLEHSPE